MYVDGASNSRGARAGIVLLSPIGILHKSTLSIRFPASNNEAEYEALISGLKVAKALGIDELVVYNDSHLVVNKLTEEYEAQDERMQPYLSSAIRLAKNFKAICIEHISREQNLHADTLTGLALACSDSGPRSILFATIDKPSFELDVLVHEVLNIDLEPSWMDKIVSYLRDDILPYDKKDAHQQLAKECTAQFLTRSIRGWRQLAEEFTARFLTSRRAPITFKSLSIMKQGENEPNKDYAKKFWETFNEIKSCNEEYAIATFRVGLPVRGELRQSLNMSPMDTLTKLMERIEQHARMEDDILRENGKVVAE